MRKYNTARNALIALIAGSFISGVYAQSVNIWRGTAEGAEWNDQYKWNLKHPPKGSEAAYFRSDNSLIEVNSTVELNNGMHLYGQELTLKGNGNINLLSPLEHQQTVNIPASADGFANLTLNDTLALTGRIALSAKTFGSSASKGSVTLNDRSSATGALAIGKDGTGTGRVYIRDNSTYRVTDLQIETKASEGGSAEIHVLSGTMRIETGNDPFAIFLEDQSRKLFIGKSGTLRIESDLSISKKKELLKELISEQRLIAAPGAQLILPVIQDKMVLVRAEDKRNISDIRTIPQLLFAIDNIPDNGASSLPPSIAPSVNSMLSNMDSETTGSSVTTQSTSASGGQMAGYMVFFGVVLLAFRRAKTEAE